MKPYSKFLGILFFLILNACGSDEPIINQVNASFEIEQSEYFANEPIRFSNTSSGIGTNSVFEWDFGDGNTSTNKNPTHSYAAIGEGTYTILLKVSNGNNESSFTKDITIAFTENIVGRKSLVEKLGENKILTCAHRGNQNNAPENSLKSIQDAINEEIEMVEIDIRQTKDGKFVLMHDSALERTTNGSGNVSDFTLVELQKLKLKDNRGVLTSEKIPTLQEALNLGRGKIYFDLDMSNNKVSFDRIYPVVKQYGMIKQSIFYTQGVSITQSALNKDENVIAMPVISNENRLSQFEDDSRIKVAHFQSQTFNQNFVSRAKAKGWFIFMNAYINTTKTPLDDNYAEVDKISNLGGNIIQTDNPVLIKEHLN
ncbi:glycerophosphodiester phosphodiesterase family protein [Polaribacter septentrionalilitoris]|uniref:glycerophosphodiester phosphodiesterase family protein n=1 Tax=Polaribacter septentrionalilitoris TaxID=2494657 RepID=UPI00135C622E|nr:glycerophosphodiester phosphodiesterase family protein [Polaribacter septentrionalilitoris]